MTLQTPRLSPFQSLTNDVAVLLKLKRLVQIRLGSIIAVAVAGTALGSTASMQSAIDLELKYGMCKRHSIPEDKCTDEIYRQLLDSELRVSRARQEAQRKAAHVERKAEKARLEKERSEREADFTRLVKDAVAEGKPGWLDAEACGSEYDPASGAWTCTDKEKEALKIALPQAEAQRQVNETRRLRSMLIGDKTYQRILADFCADPEYSARDEENKAKCKSLQDFLRDPDNTSHYAQDEKVCSQEVAGGPLVCKTK